MFDPANYEKNQKECQKKETVYLPPELIREPLGYTYPLYAYYAVVAKIPKGKVARWDDVMECLAEAYGKKCETVEHLNGRLLLELNGECPVWRVVTARGRIFDRNSVDIVKRLTEEGFTIDENRVVDYKEKLYTFKKIRFVLQKTNKQMAEAMSQMAETIKKMREDARLE